MVVNETGVDNMQIENTLLSQHFSVEKHQQWSTYVQLFRRENEHDANTLKRKKTVTQNETERKKALAQMLNRIEAPK